MKRVFAPGCALMLYKPDLASKMHTILNDELGAMELLSTCCRHEPLLTEKTQVINICSGCDKRFGNNYENTTTISLWEILAECNFFTFPDYHGQRMTIIDACPTRDKESVQNAIRTVLRKMNITLVEPKNTRTKSTCCGDSFYGVISTDKVKEQMMKRTSEMPLDEVIVYCVSCIKSIHIGGKKPRHLIDLLFAQGTTPDTFEPDEWHNELDSYIEKH